MKTIVSDKVNYRRTQS